MYCRKCHKQSPDNFVNCAYCGAKLNQPKKKVPTAFVKKKQVKGKPSFKTLVASAFIFAVALSVAAILTAVFTGSKPEKIVKNFTSAIETKNENLYYSLFDDDIKEYKKENRYFADEETFENMVSPMYESVDFYTEKCGEDYKLSYTITSSKTLSEAELKDFTECLEKGFSYIKMPSRVELLGVNITVKGDKGEYQSIYNDFWCMKIKGKWYKVDKAVYTEYEKLKTAP